MSRWNRTRTVHYASNTCLPRSVGLPRIRASNARRLTGKHLFIRRIDRSMRLVGEALLPDIVNFPGDCQPLP
jgi:hypothetical protein